MQIGTYCGYCGSLVSWLYNDGSGRLGYKQVFDGICESTDCELRVEIGNMEFYHRNWKKAIQLRMKFEESGRT